jgi:iron complex transport system substrate-binding protein
LRDDYFLNCLALNVKPIGIAKIAGFPTPKYLTQDIREQFDRTASVGNFNSPSLEKILLLKPDLIISSSQNLYDHLSYIAPTVILKNPFPPLPWKDELVRIAEILDREKESQELLNKYNQRVFNLRNRLGTRLDSMQVSISNTSSEYGIWAYGESHYSGQILNDIGIKRPEAQRGKIFYLESISKEKIEDIDGDVLFFASWERTDDEKTLAKLKQDKLWQYLKAVQKNRVYSVGGHWHNSDIYAVNAMLDDLEKYLVNTP